LLSFGGGCLRSIRFAAFPARRRSFALQVLQMESKESTLDAVLTR
jgi:hypothetical protein